MFLAGYGTDNLLHYSYLNKWVKLDRITGYVGMDYVVVVEHSERKERRKKNYCILYICIAVAQHTKHSIAYGTVLILILIFGEGDLCTRTGHRKRLHITISDISSIYIFSYFEIKFNCWH